MYLTWKFSGVKYQYMALFSSQNCFLVVIVVSFLFKFSRKIVLCDQKSKCGAKIPCFSSLCGESEPVGEGSTF